MIRVQLVNAQFGGNKGRTALAAGYQPVSPMDSHSGALEGSSVTSVRSANACLKRRCEAVCYPCSPPA